MDKGMHGGLGGACRGAMSGLHAHLQMHGRQAREPCSRATALVCMQSAGCRCAAIKQCDHLPA